MSGRTLREETMASGLMARGSRAAAAIVGIAGLFSTEAALAEPSVADLAARIELRPIEMLTEHPRIDATRIAVMGFSRGGQSALYSSMRRFQEMWSPRAVFALHIPLYASCSATFIRDTDVTAPIRQHHGLADDYVTIAPCRPYFERLRAAGRDAQLIEYPDAHHAYDNPLGAKTPTVAKGSQSVRACTLKEEAPGI